MASDVHRRDDRAWYVERLEKAGFKIIMIFTQPRHGMFCASKM